MGTTLIRGGKRLEGQTQAGCAKNSALIILAAAVMAQGEVSVTVPELNDVKHMLAILERLGCRVRREAGRALIDPRTLCSSRMPEDLSRLLRSSIFMMGSVLARCGEADFTYPGGCEIGLRPIDLHLHGLRCMGAEIREQDGRILCRGRLHPARIHLEYPSVGVTENLMMAAALTPGETVIENAAMEPEIVDLAAFLTAMGARVHGAGGKRIAVDGVKVLHGAEFTPMPDRIVAGTMLAAAAATGGSVRVSDARAGDMESVLSKLEQMGCRVYTGGGVALEAPARLRSFRTLETMPYPGFPTDMQPQMAVLECLADGAGLINERIFDNRLGYTAELIKMGADITVRGSTALIRGGSLHSAAVQVKDLRGGAALVIAGLAAQGATVLTGMEYVDRGYERIEEKLSALGADIHRLHMPE